MATDNLYNDGTNIGIGLSTPESPLQVRGSGNGNITSISNAGVYYIHKSLFTSLIHKKKYSLEKDL